MTLTYSTSPTGDQRIDGLLYSEQWAPSTLTYGFPTSYSNYDYTLGFDVVEQTFAFNSAQQAAIRFALDIADGNRANNTFSVEGFTDLNLFQGSGSSATLRFANTSSPELLTAFAFYPSTETYGGDSWFGPLGDYTYMNPVFGNYAWFTIMHEVGTTLGLTHPHDNVGGFGPVPFEYDAMEMSVMSYRSYVGADIYEGYTNESWGFAQSFMMLDIAALQSMYGADYITHSGDTHYVWAPNNGNTLIDGEVAIAPGANRIFLTVWDGGGTDTYDLSAYQTNVAVSLQPGESSLFYVGQAAVLGDGRSAAGNVYNALLFEGNLRSLIENAIGGAGDDIIIGNVVGNHLVGNVGNDELSGLEGADTLLGGAGNDSLIGGQGFDLMYGGDGSDTVVGGDGTDFAGGGAGNDRLIMDAGDDTAYGGLGADTLQGNDGNDQLWAGEGRDLVFGGADDDQMGGGTENDELWGADGADTIYGGADNDLIGGGVGNDVLWGGDGADTIYGGIGDDVVSGTDGDDEIGGFVGNDTIKGGDGADTLFGGDGNDLLVGGTGPDRLAGGLGNDTLDGGDQPNVLIGGGGADTFVFAVIADTINDFGNGSDVIDLAEADGITSYEDLLAEHVENVGSDLLITAANGATMTLLGVQIEDLSESAFMF